jgi:hypothetical protein
MAIRLLVIQEHSPHDPYIHFGAYFVFAMMSAFDNNANEKYVELLGQWGHVSDV